MSPEMRFLDTDDPDDVRAWFLAAATGFLQEPTITDEEVELRRARQDLRRARGVHDGGRCVATYRSFDQLLTVPGGAEVRANAVSAVTVSGTHRRRGLLTRMITADLAEARERGDVAATLVAAEYRIYGRFGFGQATTLTDQRVDVAQAGLDPRWAGPGEKDGGSLAFADGAEIRSVGPELHERFRRGRAGAIDRPGWWWERQTGVLRFGNAPWTEPFHVLYRDADGVVQGLATFGSQSRWEQHQPANVAEVRDLFATTPAGERALWYFLLSLDFVVTVTAPRRAADELLPDLLPNPRAAASSTTADFLWLRPLDVPRLLSARRYAAAGELVLQVRDPLGLAGGRFLLTASPEGASCVPTSTRGADLTLDTGALSSLYLGDASAARLAALGAVDEETPGAVDRADLLLRTGRRPWCQDIF
ncbi:GNAT family N-acetyltransferase [Streptomyces sp. 4N509B]|uniref:GNAT family N-acetyltransferase n=1 Tax=Streptomyces sp. 4N509B TaxID=3457413 RepID=UPI003FD5F267